MHELVLNAIKGSLVADAYSLGAHWVYDQQQLQTLPIDWNTLNNPQALWHKGKIAGDFTHYGDHTVWLVEFLEHNKKFDVDAYAHFWKEKMRDYTGYVDGSSRDTLASLEANNPSACGPASHDLSICGRIAPLLSVSSSKEDFIANALMFAKFTHNSIDVLERVSFVAYMLYAIVEGECLDKAVHIAIDHVPTLKKSIEEVKQTLQANTCDTIRTFGPACGCVEGFKGAMHLILKYDDFTKAVQENAKAGGDSAARGMIVGMIMGAQGYEINPHWLKLMHYKV